MTVDRDLTAPAINRSGSDHHCFGCGTLNEVGLKLEFRSMPDGVWAEITPDRRYEGYVGMVHGGVFATMLDEAMSWAITAGGEFAVTARMTTSFRSPARIGMPMRVEGRIVDSRRRIIDTRAVITETESGSVIAEADGRFVRVPEEQARSWREAYLDPESSR